MPVWCLECALQGRWSRCILILSRSWWIKPIGSKTSGETSRSTACGWFIRQYGTLPLFWQNLPYHWYVVRFWIYFSGHLKLLFSDYTVLYFHCVYTYLRMVPLISWEWCCRIHLNDMMQVGIVTTTTTVTTTTAATFYIHGSVHHNSILIRSNKMQQYAGIYLLQNHSTCFGCPSHPSSGVHQTVTAASGTGHSIWATTFLQHGLWPHWRKVVTYNTSSSCPSSLDFPQLIHLNLGFAACWVSSGLSILSAGIQFLHCMVVSQPPLLSYLHHFDYV